MPGLFPTRILHQFRIEYKLFGVQWHKPPCLGKLPFKLFQFIFKIPVSIFVFMQGRNQPKSSLLRLYRFQPSSEIEKYVFFIIQFHPSFLVNLFSHSLLGIARRNIWHTPCVSHVFLPVRKRINHNSVQMFQPITNTMKN